MPDGPRQLLINLDSLTATDARAFVSSAAERARLRELVAQLRTVGFTKTAEGRAVESIEALGLDPKAVALVRAGDAAQASALAEALAPGPGFRDGRRIVISTDPADLRWTREQRLTDRSRQTVSICPLRPGSSGPAEADFVARRLSEAADLVLAPSSPNRLSVVLMAFNERATIATAIAETRLFCQTYLRDYEILVVDDGSQDGTSDAARAADEGDVQVLTHPVNRGMGATMRSGYAAAKLDYLVALPADRQIRAQQLAPFLAQMAPHRCVHGIYRTPHSGQGRAIMSAAFRVIIRHVGGLAIDFAGAYVFHRHWLEQVDLARLPSQSFVFSFELLDALAQAGCQFDSIELSAFSREAGTSRVARPGRIARVFGEIARSRLTRSWQTATERGVDSREPM